MKRAGIRVTGIVQGVGFRPFIYRLAGEYALTGWVLNDEKGVWIEAEGEVAALQAFAAAIGPQAPPMAVVDSVGVSELALQGDSAFLIRPSVASRQKSAGISPDIATCEECRQELQDPANRRFGYAFTNCTNCGPRYSIIKGVPYDRPATTMARFRLCPACRAEYDDPLNRRFHAQPNACGDCGPDYQLLDQTGDLLPGREALAKARQVVMDGRILAIKGIGGYHLACDGRNAAAVAELRRRKSREEKPFAVMAGSLAMAERLCEVPAEAARLLTGPVGPIVLLRKKSPELLAETVAPGNAHLGVMLPYAPVHYLLLAPDSVWVMTSGNTSDEPIAYEDADARQRLGGIADAFLVHNREIHCRVDDSVMRVFAGLPYLLRRSRGMAPAPIGLVDPGPSVLACGGEAKNTFCLTKGAAAFVSPHIGDLENPSTLASYEAAIAHYERIFDLRPEIVAVDLHPEYLSTKYAAGLKLPRIAVQHHHAHIASVLAEHGVKEPVIGVAFDGTGYGDDGRLWGGEFLVADCRSYERLGHCCYLPLPGGEKAVRQPWRQALWVMRDLYGANFMAKRTALTQSAPAGWELLLEAAAKGINAPLTSSAGRLFDTAAALLGLRLYNTYEGQAAVELELAAQGARGHLLPYAIRGGELDFRPAFAAMVDALDKEAPAELAAAFHMTMAAAIEDMVRRISRISGIKKVALSGGVFQNMTLLQQVVSRLQADFSVLLNRRVPPNDGGLSLGQAAVARERGR